MFIFHFISANTYWRWRKISEDPRDIECLNFMFTSDSKELRRRYNFKPKEYEEFKKKARGIEYVLNVFMAAMVFMLGFFCVRGLRKAYEEVSPTLFQTLSLPMFLLTLYSYYHVTCGILTIYLLKFTTQFFLNLRAKTVARGILEFPSKFMALPKLLRNLESLKRELAQTELLDHRYSLVTTMQEKYEEFLALENEYTELTIHLEESIEDLIQQFEKANLLFDRQLSPMFFLCLFCGLLYPLYFFFDFDLLTLVSFMNFL